MDRGDGKFQNQYPGGEVAGETYNVGYTRAMLQGPRRRHSPSSIRQ